MNNHQWHALQNSVHHIRQPIHYNDFKWHRCSITIHNFLAMMDNHSRNPHILNACFFNISTQNTINAHYKIYHMAVNTERFAYFKTTNDI